MNEYAVQRTDQHHATRYYEFADSPEEAEAKFRKYWNITAPVKVTLLKTNVGRPSFDA